MPGNVSHALIRKVTLIWKQWLRLAGSGVVLWCGQLDSVLTTNFLPIVPSPALVTSDHWLAGRGGALCGAVWPCHNLIVTWIISIILARRRPALVFIAQSGWGHKSGGLDPTFKQSPGNTDTGGKQLKIESIGTSLVWEVYSQDNIWFHLLADLSW